MFKINLKVAAVCFSALASASFAETILVVTGKTPGGQPARIEMSYADLEALPQQRIETLNNYVQKVTVFEGPLMQDVLKDVVVGPETEVKATAINDYFVTIPASDFLNAPVILAILRDGDRMSVRDKGPIWVIYQTESYSDETDPTSAVVHNRLIWQLRSLEAQ